jgi:hypothetical protein
VAPERREQEQRQPGDAEHGQDPPPHQSSSACAALGARTQAVF